MASFTSDSQVLDVFDDDATSQRFSSVVMFLLEFNVILPNEVHQVVSSDGGGDEDQLEKNNTRAPTNIRKYDLRPKPHNFLFSFRDDTNYISWTLLKWLRPNP